MALFALFEFFPESCSNRVKIDFKAVLTVFKNITCSIKTLILANWTGEDTMARKGQIEVTKQGLVNLIPENVGYSIIVI